MLGLLLCCLLAVTAVAQDAVDFSSDPHFSHVFANQNAVVYELELAPDQSTALLRPSHNFLLITLDDSTITLTRKGMAPIVNTPLPSGDGRFIYADPPFVIGAKGGIYRAIVVEMLDPNASTYGYQYESGKWDWGARAFQPPLSERATQVMPLELNTTIAWSVQLMPGDSLPAGKGPAWLAIAITDFDLKGDGEGQPALLQMDAGEVGSYGPGPRPKLTNTGDSAARFVIVNFGRDIEMPPVITIAR
jgi:hypothetical protein